MCTKLRTAPDPSCDSTAGPGDARLLQPGKMCRCADDCAAIVLCEHADGRTQVHCMSPRDALVDDELVNIRVLAAWPTLALEDKKP